MTHRLQKLIMILITVWIAGILFYSLKEAREQNSIIKSSGMVLIQGGCYEMGDPFDSRFEDEHPVHMVCVDPFYVGKELVSVGEFKRFVADTGYQTDAEKSEEFSEHGEREGKVPSGSASEGGGASPHKGCEVREGSQLKKIGDHNWRNPGYSQTDLNPVVCVSWNDASRFIQWIREKSPKKGMAYRLLTEAEWEFGARNRGKQVSRNFLPQETRSFRRTPNLREWLGDWYGENFYKEGNKTNPSGPSTGKYRVLRGDFLMNNSERIGVFSRYEMAPQSASSEAGFRLALPLSDR